MNTSDIIERCPRCGGENFSMHGYGYSLNHTLSIYCNDCDTFVHRTKNKTKITST